MLRYQSRTVTNDVDLIYMQHATDFKQVFCLSAGVFVFACFCDLCLGFVFLKPLLSFLLSLFVRMLVCFVLFYRFWCCFFWGR